MKSSRFGEKDAVFIFSVGGGSTDPNVSTQLINAAKEAKNKGGIVFSILGKSGGVIKGLSDASIIVPTVNNSTITAHTEGMQAYLWHFLISHPELNPNIPKWEGLEIN
jgi:D-sedoheptulose 7-phosphate isomerase